MEDNKTLSIYTDGSAKGDKGSWAFVVVDGGKVIHEGLGTVDGRNSNQMEFQAVIECLKYLPIGSKAVIYSDFKILIDTVTQWMPEWKLLGWVKRKNKTIHNLDQIKEIDSLVSGLDLVWKWIPAHKGNVYNERCDEICRIARS
jgi:ribonuclease HI